MQVLKILFIIILCSQLIANMFGFVSFFDLAGELINIYKDDKKHRKMWKCYRRDP